jgi:hypothetical protein
MINFSPNDVAWPKFCGRFTNFGGIGQVRTVPVKIAGILARTAREIAIPVL